MGLPFLGCTVVRVASRVTRASSSVYSFYIVHFIALFISIIFILTLFILIILSSSSRLPLVSA